MQDHSTSQALTEVALALAMAFFALFILALLSMGAAPGVIEPLPHEQLKIAGSASQVTAKESQYLIYYQQQYYDLSLQTINLAQLAQYAANNRPVVLAVEQSLAIIELISLKQQINHPNLSITTLTEQWLIKLEHL